MWHTPTRAPPGHLIRVSKAPLITGIILPWFLASICQRCPSAALGPLQPVMYMPCAFHQRDLWSFIAPTRLPCFYWRTMLISSLVIYPSLPARESSQDRSGFERFLFHNDDNPALPHSKILIIDIQAVLLLEGIITLYLIPCFGVIK